VCPKAGEKARISKSNKTVSESKLMTGANKQEKLETLEEKFVYVETILEKPDPKES